MAKARIFLCLLLAAPAFARSCAAQSVQDTANSIAANPGRPTVSNPATLVPAGHVQFENGLLGATGSAEFSSYYEIDQTAKFAVNRRFEFIESSQPEAHFEFAGKSSDSLSEVEVGAQAVIMPGEGMRPTVAVSYSRRVYGGSAPDLDTGSARDYAVLYVSGDYRALHVDANAFFNDQVQNGAQRMQYGQSLSVAYPLDGQFALAGEIWRFTQPFLHGNAIGNLWALTYKVKPNLILDGGFEKGLTGTSTHWRAFTGFTYLLPHRFW